MDYDLVRDEDLTNEDWQKIKTSNPERYLNYTHGIILKKLDDVIPQLDSWQKYQSQFPLYRQSLPSIESQINLLDFSEYEELEGKYRLTDLYFKNLSMYDTSSILSFVHSNCQYNEWKIKNLLTRSFILLKKIRSKTIERISKYTKLSYLECEELPILSYLPIQHHSIGIEWIFNNENLSIDGIIRKWFVLLCVDTELFSSEEFLIDLKLKLSVEKFEYLCMNSAVLISSSPKSYPPFRIIRDQALIQKWLFKKQRLQIIERISRYTKLSINKCEELPIINYLPIKNHSEGMAWMLKEKSLSIKDVVDKWFILLCINEKLFSTQDFLNDMKAKVGDRTYYEICLNMSILMAKKPDNYPPFIYLRIHNNIKELVEFIDSEKKKGCEIIQYVSSKKLNFKNKKIFYGNKYAAKCNGIQNKFDFSFELKDHSFCLIVPKFQVPKLKSFQFMPANDLELLFSAYKQEILEYGQCRLQELDALGEKMRIESTISTKVKANELKIEKGFIFYRDYYLQSVRILDNVSNDILAEIEHEFTLVKDNSETKKDIARRVRNLKKFIFSPANDFSFLLAEIERLSEGRKRQDSKFEKDGIFELPWEFVKFYDGIMYLIHPNPSKRGTITPFQYRNYSILKSFKDIMPYIETHCPKFKVLSKDGVIIDVLNFDAFSSKIDQFKEYSDFKENELVVLNSKLINGTLKSFNVDLFKKLTIVNKSPYLRFLSSRQRTDKNIEFILEQRSHSASISESEEYGYLFYLGNKTVVFENITDLSRSSLIFYINSKKSNNAIDLLRRFLASSEINKREKLTYNQIKFDNGLVYGYTRSSHTNFYDWKYNMLSKIK